jgi:hypothetical protein
MLQGASSPRTILQDVVLSLLGGLFLLCVLVTAWVKCYRGRHDAPLGNDLETELNNDADTFHGPGTEV